MPNWTEQLQREGRQLSKVLSFFLKGGDASATTGTATIGVVTASISTRLETTTSSGTGTATKRDPRDAVRRSSQQKETSRDNKLDEKHKVK